MGEVIAVVSGKGGTGKSAFCAGVATVLAAKGFRILCVDCAVGLRNLDIYLGLADSGVLSFQEIAQGGYPLTQAAVHPSYPQLRFLTAPANGQAEQVDYSAFAGLIQRAKPEFDYIFLDAPSGLGAGMRLAAANADRCVVVTGCDPAAIRDAGRIAQELELMGSTAVRLVVNRIQAGLLRQMKLNVDDMMDRTGLPLLGIVPEDPSILLAAAMGKSLGEFHSKSSALGAFNRIGQRICGKSVAIPHGKFK